LFARSGRRDHALVPELLQISRANRGQTGAVRDLARRQHGIVDRAQLLGAGVSRWTLDRALRTGRLHRIHPGVYSTLPPEHITEDGLLIAALHATGPESLLSHATAAWRWNLIPAPPTTIELAAPKGRRAPAGVTLHASALRPTDATHHRNLPTTTVPRTLLDLATHYTRTALLRALAEAEFHHDLRPTDVDSTLRRGHPGSANLRAALKAHTPSRGSVRSNLERRFRRLLIRHGIELPARNHRVGPWTVDCLWPDRRVVVELDGRQHERPRQADEDDDRDLWLRRHGYVARRYGERQIAARPNAVVADLEAAFVEAATLGYAAAGVPLRL
jgi:very-short-patch-repair endonuclease